MKEVIRLAIVLCLVGMSQKTNSQELTREQVDANLRMQTASANAPIRLRLSKQPKYRGIIESLNEMLANQIAIVELENNTRVRTLDMSAASMSLSSEAGMVSVGVQSGTSYIQELISGLGISENEMFGKPGFDSGLGWHTDVKVPGVTYPWTAVVPRELYPQNGAMAVYSQSLMGNGKLWCSMPYTPLTFVNPLTGFQVTDPASYVLRFKYTWDMQNPNTSFWCSTTPNIDKAVAVMTPASTWTQVTTVLTNTSASYVYWGHSCGVGSIRYNTVKLDAVQFIPIPKPTSSEFSIIGNSDDTVTVQWNTLTYPGWKWVLEYAYDVQGPWTVSSATPSVNDFVASLTFAKDNRRFYRLKHR